MGGILIILLMIATAIVAVLFSGLIPRSKSETLFSYIKDKTFSIYSETIHLVSNIKFSDLKNLRSFSDLIGYSRSKKISVCESDLNTKSDTELDMNVLNCRVQLTKLKEGKKIYDALGVEICGSIHTPGDNHNASLFISISDICGTRSWINFEGINSAGML